MAKTNTDTTKKQENSFFPKPSFLGSMLGLEKVFLLFYKVTQQFSLFQL